MNERPMKFTRNSTASSAGTLREAAAPRRTSRARPPRGRRRRPAAPPRSRATTRTRATAQTAAVTRKVQRMPIASARKPPGQRPDGRGQDLRGLDRAHRAARLLARGAARWPWPGPAGRCRRTGPTPDAQGEELPDVGDARPRARAGRRRRRSARTAIALLAVAVGQPSPDRRQQPGQQRRHADEDARPERHARRRPRRPARARRAAGRAARTRSR